MIRKTTKSSTVSMDPYIPHLEKYTPSEILSNKRLFKTDYIMSPIQALELASHRG